MAYSEDYNDLLAENNLLDFSSIMAETFRMLSENREVLEELRSKITHIMVDEYQDTNNIQEQIIFLLAGNRKNICVVGDDDQGLYRFRGARFHKKLFYDTTETITDSGKYFRIDCFNRIY